MKKKIKLNAPLRGFKEHAVIAIDIDKSGTPIDKYWQDRFFDSKTDNCIEIYKKAKESHIEKREDKSVKLKRDGAQKQSGDVSVDNL